MEINRTRSSGLKDTQRQVYDEVTFNHIRRLPLREVKATSDQMKRTFTLKKMTYFSGFEHRWKH